MGEVESGDERVCTGVLHLARGVWSVGVRRLGVAGIGEDEVCGWCAARRGGVWSVEAGE